MDIATYFKGRISYIEVLELDMPHFMSLRHMRYIESQTKTGQEGKQAEVIMDALEEGLT